MPVTIKAANLKYKNPDGEYVGVNSIIDEPTYTKAPVIVNTAEGDIASFNDGADGMPIQKLTVQIDPVQDLHGYDHPWPAGGGKNKFDKDKLSDLSEYKTLANGYHYTDPITLLPNTNYIMAPTVTEKVDTNSYYVLYKNPDASDPDYLVITNPAVQYPVAAGVPTVISFTTGATGVIRFGVMHSQSTGGPQQQALQAFMSIDYQIEEGSSATTWTPYSNECPISGWAGVNVYEAGKNLVPMTAISRTNSGITYTVNEDGSVTINGTATATSWLRGITVRSEQQFLKAGAYHLSGTPTGQSATVYIVGTYADGTTIDNSNVTGGVYDLGNGLNFTLLKDAYITYQIQVIKDVTLDNVTVYPQIVLGSATSSYELYQGSTYPITFPTEAGAVYGGSLTIAEDGTGQLVVDRGVYTFTGNESWNVSSTSNRFFVTISEWISQRMAIQPITANAEQNIISSIYGKFVYKNADGVCYVYNNNSNQFILVVNTTAAETIGDIKSVFSNTQLIYELTEPITYSLTALEVLETLKGVNNIWADCGTVEVTYRADTKTYVDDAIPSVPVQDVQVNGTSIIQNGVANVPKAGTSVAGVVKIAGNGIGINDSGGLYLNGANASQVKNGTYGYGAVTAMRQHESTFYGLTKAAGVDMASSPNAVGTYTDAAKVAIQKMLGIYQAPWELIREDTVTNEAEADINITVDGNGESFELTDVYLQVWTPQQETGASIGDYGTVRNYYSDSGFITSQMQTWEQAPGASTKYGQVLLKNENGAVINVVTLNNSQYALVGLTGRTNMIANDALVKIGAYTFNKTVIKKVTGTINYRLYGRRKWN